MRAIPAKYAFAIWLGAAVLALMLAGGPSLVALTVPCVACHAMDERTASLQKGPHEAVGCLACHAHDAVARYDLGVRILGQMTPKALGVSASAPVLVSLPGRRACVKCHAESQTDASSSKGLRVSHSDCAESMNCAKCHGSGMHPVDGRWVRSYVMEECVACHQARSATTECDSCHDGRGPSDRLNDGPWQITHGPNWERSHGMGSVASCATCHPKDYCSRCHGTPIPHAPTWGMAHGKTAITDRSKCVTCHADEAICNRCHGVEMPHPQGFLKKHSSMVERVPDIRCSKCHDDDDCNLCHSFHVHPGWAAAASKAGGK